MKATTGETNKKRVAAWDWWTAFLHSIEIGEDPFLDTIEAPHKTKLLCCFAQSVRNLEHSSQTIRPLASSSVRTTVDDVAATFRDNQRQDPRLDKGRKPSRLLSRLYAGYTNQDPPTKPQKAMPISILRKLHNNTSSHRAIVISELATGAFFFTMRSCKYLLVTGERKTKLLRLRNIRFFRHGREIQHNNPLLSLSDYVSITFEDQKNGERIDTITMHNACDLILCPVVAWAKIVKRVSKIPWGSPDSKVNAFYSDGHTYHVSGTDMLQALRSAALSIGEAKLGFHHSDIGTHSLRSGAAMAMYLDEIPVYTIMLIGRWSSDAFLRYIRKQVEQFSHNVSRRMIKHQHFTHVPQFAPQSSRHDPRQRNHRDNFQTRNNMGGAGTSVVASFSRLSLWN